MKNSILLLGAVALVLSACAPPKREPVVLTDEQMRESIKQANQLSMCRERQFLTKAEVQTVWWDYVHRDAHRQPEGREEAIRKTMSVPEPSKQTCLYYKEAAQQKMRLNYHQAQIQAQHAQAQAIQNANRPRNLSCNTSYGYTHCTSY